MLELFLISLKLLKNRQEFKLCLGSTYRRRQKRECLDQSSNQNLVLTLENLPVRADLCPDPPGSPSGTIPAPTCATLRHACLPNPPSLLGDASGSAQRDDRGVRVRVWSGWCTKFSIKPLMEEHMMTRFNVFQPLLSDF